MLKRTDVLFVSVLVGWFLYVAHAQTAPAVSEQPVVREVVVVTPEAKSDSVIAVPPATGVRFGPPGERHAGTIDLAAWLHQEAALNGLESTELQPWHIAVVYDQFDEDGDNVHSGVYEEFWAGPKKYKRIYKSDNFNQADYATERGLFRLGNQQWPDRAESQVRAEIVAPFYYAEALQGFSARSVKRAFGRYKLQCVLVETGTRTVSDPTQYCFEPDGSVLRYARGWGWFQTAYNGIVSFQGRNIAREVEVTKAGKPYLKLHVDMLEMISHLDEADLTPPPDAVSLLGKRVSGVNPSPIIQISPEWPTSLRGQHFSVEVEIVMGKDGHVVSAQAVSGPPEARKACEDAVRKWTFSPYLVLGEPVEVETKAMFTVQLN
jgi:hypothetical protein